MSDTREHPRDDDPLCAYCGGTVPALGAIVYHGVVYHPACVAPTTRRKPDRGIDDDSADGAAKPRQS